MERRKALLLIGGIALAVAVEAADYFSGNELLFSFFYLLVVLYFAYFFGLFAAIATSIVSGLASVLTDMSAGAGYSHPALAVWTAAIRVCNFLVVAITFSLLQRNRAAMKHLIGQLKTSNEELEFLNSMISHDLKTHLQVMKLHTSLLNRKSELDADVRQLAAGLDRSTENMTRLISDVLQYTRTAQEKGAIEKVDLEGLCGEIVTDLGELIAEKNGTVTIGSLPILEANPVTMRQLFQNLISNALKYCERTPEITIDSRVTGGEAVIRVSDNGIGFNPEDADKAFAPFQRLHGGYEGSGIGLSLCKKIVEQHHGSITAESEPGVGSTFFVRIPLSQPPRD